MKKIYGGGCQCGAVRFEVSADIGEVISCNCSRCSRLGWLPAFVPASDFHLKTGENATTDYQFNKHNIHHLFCSACGIESYARGKVRGAPRWSRSTSGASMASSRIRSK